MNFFAKAENDTVVAGAEKPAETVVEDSQKSEQETVQETTELSTSKQQPKAKAVTVSVRGKPVAQAVEKSSDVETLNRQDCDCSNCVKQCLDKCRRSRPEDVSCCEAAALAIRCYEVSVANGLSHFNSVVNGANGFGNDGQRLIESTKALGKIQGALIEALKKLSCDEDAADCCVASIDAVTDLAALAVDDILEKLLLNLDTENVLEAVEVKVLATIEAIKSTVEVATCPKKCKKEKKKCCQKKKKCGCKGRSDKPYRGRMVAEYASDSEDSDDIWGSVSVQYESRRPMTVKDSGGGCGCGGK